MICNKASQLQGIDIFKYIMAFAVVAIHCLGEYPVWFQWFIRLAVPFFFVTSGFLLARALDNIKDKDQQVIFLRERTYKIFRLFGLWVLIYLPLSCVGYVLKGTPLFKIPFLMIYSIIVNGEILYAWALWFLYSLGLNTFAISIIKRRPQFKIWYFIIVGIFYVLYSIVDRYDLSDTVPYYQLLLKVLPLRAIAGGAYLIMGFLTYKYLDIIGNLTVAFASLIVSFLIRYLDLPFSEIIGGISIFLIAYKLPVYDKSKLCLSLRTQSMWIYYLHMYVVFFMFKLPEFLHRKIEFSLSFVATLMIIAIIAALLTRLQARKKFAFLGVLTR